MLQWQGWSTSFSSWDFGYLVWSRHSALKRAVGGGAAKKCSGDSSCLWLDLDFKLKVSLGLSYQLY